MTNLTPAEAHAAAEFAAAISSRDYRAAANLITNVTNAGDIELAALLLQGVIDAGVEAVEQMASQRTVSVTQTFDTIPAGATVVGYQSRRSGR